MITGFDDIDEASQTCEQIREILSQGKFELRKWVSNESVILNKLNIANISVDKLTFGENENTKTLGIEWCPCSDSILYNVNMSGSQKTVSKRSILSSVAQIFVPLGLLSLCIIQAKILLQKLWLEKLSWDDSIPLNLKTQWDLFLNDLNELNTIKIPRNTVCINSFSTEIHVFSDVSLNAYGTCVYIRRTNHENFVSCHLLCSKSKVAPLKVISIPRL